MLAFNPYILLAGPSCNCSWNVLLSWPGNRPNLKHSHQNSVPPLQQRGRLILSLTDITALTLDKITTHPFWWANAGSFNQASTTLVCANGQKSTSGAIVQATTQTLYAPHIANSSLPCPNPPERPLIQRPQQSLESLNNKFLLLHPFNPVNINRLRNLLTTSQRVSQRVSTSTEPMFTFFLTNLVPTHHLRTSSITITTQPCIMQILSLIS